MQKENTKILLVDDDKDILVAAKFLLKKHFSEIFTSDTPGSVHTLIHNNRFDIALIDMNYSTGATNGKEGLELLNTIKTSSPTTRVIMMTAYGDIDLAIKAIKKGASDFIVKPWDNAKLISTIHATLTKETNNEPQTENNNVSGDGSYHKPFSEEERIFMFLDIRSSTSIAEQLGHIRYFELLNDFFRDITDPISQNQGEIYQYVGDEIVVSWPVNERSDHSCCLDCFFDIQQIIESKSDFYLDKYKLKPDFKAGMHMGVVSTGTVGTIKREIIYTGDVLNTTSRIEGLCNQYKVDLLISETLAGHIKDQDKYRMEQVGIKNLRGKSGSTGLFTVMVKPDQDL